MGLENNGIPGTSTMEGRPIGYSHDIAQQTIAIFLFLRYCIGKELLLRR